MIAVTISLSGCQDDLLDNKAKGEALGSFNLTAPANNSSLSLNSAYPNNQVVLSWSAAPPGVSISPTYTWVATVKGGDITKPLISIPSDNEGKATQLTITYKALDNALKAAGIPDQAESDLVWAVVADNGSVKVQSTEVFNINITRFGVGITNFVLYGPKPTSTNLELETGGALKFVWQKAVATTGTITYKVVAVDANNAANKLEFVSDKAGADTVLNLTHEALSDALLAKGYPAGSPVALNWTVNATASTTTQSSVYTNSLPVVLIGKPTKLYLVGGSVVADWTPDNAVGLVYMGDGKFDMYQYITVSGDGFKFLPQKGSWDGDIGKVKNVEGELVSDNEDNVKVSTDGFYRIEVAMNIDKKTGTYKVTPTNWGIIGSSTAKDWNSSTPMALTSNTKGTYTWIITTDLKAGEMKFRANDSWDINFGDDGHDGSLEYNSGSNIPVPTAGNYTITLNLAPTGYTYSLVKN
ncbi:SusE domain-containing protein [Solitalea sp. MAHUQ-68]|uniref:SusE domain-containing protein n=1 Tax=Solitalea agri TaxID=2953739 RepID=A0A9X2F9N5_9SPHI|nr:SusE domain-containing protein [Solitalea agri]MCO4294393.1 SusE domain-containing protein [Solitalea agri]